VIRNFCPGFIRSVASIVFPYYCPECQTEKIDGKGWICEDCWRQLEPAGKGKWNVNPSLVERVFVAFHYGEIARKLVHQMKFYGRTDIAEEFGQRAAEFLMLGDTHWKFDAIFPIPLHPVRIRERGYDQNLLIAGRVAEVTGLPLRTDLVRRVKHTTAQSRLSDSERLTNLRGAFRPISSVKASLPDSILIVDDVIHTGATILSCMEALNSFYRPQTYILAVCG